MDYTLVILLLLIERVRRQIRRRRLFILMNMIVCMQLVLDQDSRSHRRHRRIIKHGNRFVREGSYQRYRRKLKTARNPNKSTLPLRYISFHFFLEEQDPNWVIWKLRFVIIIPCSHISNQYSVGSSFLRSNIS